MAEFLTPAWIADLGTAAAGATAPPEVRVVLQQVVHDDASGDEVAYAVRVQGGEITVEPGRVHDATITFTQDRTTAAAIARGELAAQVAFLTGRLRVGGDLPGALSDARLLAGLTDVFAATRSTTSW